MASSETYSTSSIIDIMNDPFVVNRGTVTRSGGKIRFNAGSKCTFSKSFGNEGLSTKKLKVDYLVDSSGLTTRYNNNISIKLKVTYLDRQYDNGEYVYTDANTETIEIIPYGSNEDKGNFTNDIIDTDGSFIKQMDTIISFNGSSGHIDLDKLNIYNTFDLDEKSLNEYIENNVTTDPNITDYINDLINSKIQEGCYIRLLQTQADLSTVQEGELCRCAWIS